ncbi:MAG: hypothetical protein NTX85_02460 [Candidatus Nomurabacteria bacterium]|nr:hypothetical protein [Candidatus Nomurabacteria bacterium]
MENEEETKEQSDPTCMRCGLRVFGDECQACGTPVVLDKKDKEEEDDNYSWREHKR